MKKRRQRYGKNLACDTWHNVITGEQVQRQNKSQKKETYLSFNTFVVGWQRPTQKTSDFPYPNQNTTDNSRTTLPSKRPNWDYLRMLMQPLPLVRKNMLLSLFQEISFTSNLNCSSVFGRWVLTSMNVTISSLFPTAMVWPSGLQQMLIFSPIKGIK